MNEISKILLAVFAVTLNIGEVIGTIDINQVFTITISILSIIYLIFGIINRYKESIKYDS
jgi:predicted transcriptional regulator